MKRLLTVIFLLILIAVPVDAMEFTAPTAPQSAQRYLPDDTQSFGEGLQYVLRSALDDLNPSISEATEICASLIVVSLLVALLVSAAPQIKTAVSMAGLGVSAVLILEPVNSLISLGTDTVQQVSQYGKLLMPVMTGALAAQGAVTKSGAIFTATVFFDALLSAAVTDLLTPLVYIFLCISVASRFFAQSLLGNLKDTIKRLITWGLKTVLYIFTGYISITGVVSGSTDAAMLKATKLTIASAVPVVGSILSDASEAVLVSAGLMKNAAGIYGLLAMIAIGIGPFLKIGVQYLLLKVCAGICQMFGTPQIAGVVKDYSDSMGLVLAMIGSVCIILLISIICFMRGVG